MNPIEPDFLAFECSEFSARTKLLQTRLKTVEARRFLEEIIAKTRTQQAQTAIKYIAVCLQTRPKKNQV
jgi:hypothetical protein